MELLPGKITGSINLSSETINSGTVSASATDGSGSASSSFTGNSFSLVVAAGKTWKLTFNLSVAAPNNAYAQFQINTADTIAVGANETLTHNFNLATTRITADVQVAHGTLSGFGYMQAYGSSSDSTSFSSYTQSTGWVPVLPMNSVQVYGTAALLSSTGQSSNVALSAQTLNVGLGGATATWNVDAAFVSSTIQGTLQLTGGPTMNSAQIYIYGPNSTYNGVSLSGNGTFQFDNLQAGYYSSYAYTNFGQASLNLYRSFELKAGEVATLNFVSELATANIGLNLTGFLNSSNLSYAYIYGNGPDNAYGYTYLNSNGGFTPVVTTGAWSFSSMQLGSYDSAGSNYLYRSDASSTATTFAAGDNLTLAPVAINTTQTEFTFDVIEPAGATSETLISNPSISGYAYRYSPSGQYLGYLQFNSYGNAYNQAKPRVRIVGEPGTYNVQASAYVDGSNVSFGSFTIELKEPITTPVGTGVTVAPGADVSLTFDNVTTSGVTTVSQLPVGPALPGGYSNVTSGGTKVYYSASTTAVFSGYIDVTVPFDPTTVPAELESRLHLFYYDKATETWIDITTSVDQANNKVTGTAPALSTFALGLPHDPVIDTITVPVTATAGTALNLSASFTDVDPGEQHTALWSWGASGSSAGAVDEATRTVTGEHTFSAGGTYDCMLTVTDITGLVAKKKFSITVTGGSRDTTAPVITTAGNLTAEATSAAGAAVTFKVTANDDKDGAVAVTLSAASGSTFPLGTTTVTATARDAAGNLATATFTVTVVDTIAPVITAPANQVIEATSAAGAAASFAAIATDATGATVTYSVASGSTFPLGTTTVTATATDAGGNKASATFTVTVRDTTAPVISSVSTNAPSLWPANHKMVAVTVSASATDAVGPVSYRIVSATSSEPDNGLGDGDTPNDIEITGAMTLNLRAERSGTGNGRTYTITVEAKDAAGNKSTSTVKVVVPKSQSGK